jgi:hypothetical protein
VRRPASSACAATCTTAPHARTHAHTHARTTPRTRARLTFRAPPRGRLSEQALADLCVARQLYSASVSRIKQQRQLLILQLSQLLVRWAPPGGASGADGAGNSGMYATSRVFDAVTGAPPRRVAQCSSAQVRVWARSSPGTPLP